MKQSQKASPAPAYPPTEVSVKISSVRTEGPVLANASVDINGCFAVRGVRVINGSKGPFVSMPGHKTAEGYKDVCFPCTKEFREKLHGAVLGAYQQAMEQLPQRQNEAAQKQAAPEMGMTM